MQGIHHLSVAGEGLFQQAGSLPDPVPDGSVSLLGIAGVPMELLPLAGVEHRLTLANGAQPGDQGPVFCNGLPQTLGGQGGGTDKEHNVETDE